MRLPVSLAVCMLMDIFAFAGTTCIDGIASALPVKDGSQIVIDGKLDDWDRSGAVLCWNAAELADKQNAAVYFMYDVTNLYIAAEMALYDHEATNENRPQDRYWRGDLIQVRLSTDRSLPYPLPQRTDQRLKANPAVTCINLWRNTRDGSDNLYVTPGAMFDCENILHPAGSAVKTSVGPRTLTIESRVPWSALGVADGRCPFAGGEMMPAVVDIKWMPGTDGYYTATVYRQDPGGFAFMNIDKWGRIRFEEKGGLARGRETFASIAAAARNENAVDTAGWTEISFNLPRRAKVSVNIFDEKGGVVRELMGGEWRDSGLVKAYWDGRDALGFPCATGREYRWGAYAHDGIDVKYFGTVGTCGTPPYDTRGGTGGWGGDHGPVVDVACDSTGRYFVWHKNESGRGIVKTDFNGKVLWRTMPFVVDGWGNYSCIAAADGKVYLVYERREPGNAAVKLVRLDAATGDFELFPCGRGDVDIAVDHAAPRLPPDSAIRSEYAFNCAGIAVRGGDVFVSDYTGGRILVLDALTGAEKRSVTCPKPRGICCVGDILYVARICDDLRGGSVVAIPCSGGSPRTVVHGGLCAPYDVALDSAGRLHVSDLGSSQQVKTFSSDGRLLRTLGRTGGRVRSGKIDESSFLMPFGVATDITGALIVTEASSPKIVSVFDISTGAVRGRFYGYTSYSPSNVPDCDDPLLQYYSLSGPDSFARARLPDGGGIGTPDAVWDFPGEGLAEFGSVMSTMTMPVIVKASNGRKYFVPDATSDHDRPSHPMTICLVDGDAMRPVGSLLCGENPEDAKSDTLELWMDSDGDGRIGVSEVVRTCAVAGRRFKLAHTCGALHMGSDGTLYVLTLDNFVFAVPCRGFSSAGVPQWDIAAAYLAIPEIIPGGKSLFCGWREGLVGLRRDSFGNFYASVAYSPDYVTKEYTKYMRQGMGHTSNVGAVLLTKYDKNGSLVWRAGRKAVGGLKPGEILHHWCHAGMIGDDYTVAASEWGVFTVYTADGFFVDSLFDPPGFPGRGIPYSFGGEDFSGRIRYFPARDEVWAYNAGHTFRVTGFEKGRVRGEWRTEGRVRLDAVQPLAFPGKKPKPIDGVSIARCGGNVVFRAHVKDDSPLVNIATRANGIFKGGDAVGFEVGPGTESSELPARHGTVRRVGYTRILAARFNGGDRVVALKPFSDVAHLPQEYATPAGGRAEFEFVGEVPGAAVVFARDGDGLGYTAEITVPEAFFELDFARGVYGDVQALFSGEGGRGVQSVRRVYLYNPESSATSMVDDAPTESRLRPGAWKEFSLQDPASALQIVP